MGGGGGGGWGGGGLGVRERGGGDHAGGGVLKVDVMVAGMFGWWIIWLYGDLGGLRMGGVMGMLDRGGVGS